MPPTTYIPPVTTGCSGNYYYDSALNVCRPYQTGGPNYYYPPTTYYPSYNYSYQQPVSYYQPQQSYVYPATYYYPTTTYVQPPVQTQVSEVRYNVGTQTETRYVDGGTNVTYVAQAQNVIRPTTTVVSAGELDTFNVRIVSDAQNNTIISWDNNMPTYGEVVFGFTSQPIDNLSNYSYDFTTGRLADLNAHHEANLGQLELNRPYYIRIISRAENGATDITSETTYIPVPGKSADIVINQTNGSASAFATLIGFFTSGWFFLILLLLVILILVMIIVTKRRASNN